MIEVDLNLKKGNLKRYHYGKYIKNCLMYGVLSDKTNYNIYIFENGEFELLPPQKNKLDNYEILILKTLAGNQYNAAEVIRKSRIIKTLVYDRLKSLQDIGLIVKLNRKHVEFFRVDFLELI